MCAFVLFNHIMIKEYLQAEEMHILPLFFNMLDSNVIKLFSDI